VIPGRPADNDQLFVTRRPCGRGQIVLVACELGDLLKHGTQSQTLIRYIIESHRRDQPEDIDQYGTWRIDLFSYVGDYIGFGRAVMAYLLAAFAFVALYVATATGGSWIWLVRRNMSRHAWITFSAVAILGSGASVGAVQLIRGIGLEVHELAVVDADAGSPDSATTTYLGLKAAKHTEIDLKVPTDWRDLDDESISAAPAALRPLTPVAQITGMDVGSVFTAGQRYQAIPQAGELHDVPLRATLKQFEGFRHGDMEGQISGGLRRRPGNTAELSDSSWIRNDLPFDLTDCYLFTPAWNFRDGRTNRASLGIYALKLEKLKSGETITIGRWIDILTEARRKDSGNPDAIVRQTTTNLGDLQSGCSTTGLLRTATETD
jgi:hypothetical protein